ncbi:MAG TPA: CBS domain-containing protein, partial [Acetobacteraceae bacterium]|nr:CBS domain-containing protein [Acetobacteraceae bacterium]
MSAPVISIAPEATIKAAARLLVSCGISALPVIDAKGALVGIVSEADLIPIETRPDPRSQATPLSPAAGTAPRIVADVMTRNVVTVPTDCEVSQAARLMIEAEVKRLPVMDGQRLAGI